ncbi:putative tubulin-specific chaperone Rbl2 [Xylariaceae sp. FL0662B]|nr:putative tubulin-specific chaperone Rbl2 [Xylariaceae sp. FL0662B]
MPAPSPLTIATQSVQRLVKEEQSYRKELASQTARVNKLETTIGSADDDNAEFMLKQERKAVEETKAVFAPLRERIAQAVNRLEEQIATAESEGEGAAPADEEITRAREALELGRGVQPEPEPVA